MSVARFMQMATSGVAAAPAAGTFVDSATANATATSVTIDYSSISTQSGDVAIVAVSGTNSTASYPSTSGWTNVDFVKGNDTRDGSVSVAYRVLDGTETSVTAPVNNSFGGAAIILVFRNIDQTTPLDVTHTTQTTIDTNNAVTAAITPSNDSTIVCLMGASSEADSSSVTVVNSSLDEVFAEGVTGISGVTTFVAAGYAEDQAGGSTFASTTFTASNVDTIVGRQSAGAVTLALRKA